ncbi:MAG: glycine--tRNA ligase subunit beta [Litorimonas sp.]
MAELLFEIFCEEIPARMQVRAGQDLSKALIGGLKKAGLTVEGEQCYTGPRRLVFTADIPLRSPDISEERKGPRVGSPEQALAGFMKAAGLTDISQAETRNDPKKGDFYVAVMNSEGRDSADIIAELIPATMNNFPWPKSMKSGNSSFRWVRPLQSMICLLDGNVVPVEVGGITAGNGTEGHRRHGKGPFTVKDFTDYRAQLEGPKAPHGHVMISAQDRKDKILTDAKAACAAKGLELVEDEALLSEVAGLAEWPVVLLGDMDESFLELPDEVIRLTLKSHQKTFTVRDPKTGALAPYYIIVANQSAPDGGTSIIKGNGKVISARLSDARFFQDEDRKNKLESYYEKLGTVVFHKKLGSVRDKAERVAALARKIAPKVGADADKAEQAARLAKCDLVTQTVIEFTSLQGQIGAQIYRHEGGDADIATAIEEHYKPVGPSDSVPTNPVAVAVALADKLDTLVGFWAIDEKPTGSKDPYALRRAALGVVRIILENGVRLDLLGFIYVDSLSQIEVRLKIDEVSKKVHVVNKAAQLGAMKRHEYESWRDSQFSAGLSALQSGEARDENFALAVNLHVFILDRLKVYLRDQGLLQDHIDAVLKLGGKDLVFIVARVKALSAFLETEAGTNLLAGYKRAANILKAEAKKGDLPQGLPNRPDDIHGARLFEALQTVSADIKTALNDENYTQAMTSLAALRDPIDKFFTEVHIMSDNIDVMQNNLRLLGLIRDTAHQIADFEMIQG